MGQLHSALKEWLITLGTKYSYESRSGDNSPYLEIQQGRWKHVFRPDVIWKYKNSIFLFELAFTEDWRAIIGELCLAGMNQNVELVFIVTTPDATKPERAEIEEKDFKKYVSAVAKRMNIKYGVELLCLPSDFLKNTQIIESERRILKVLGKQELITKGQYLQELAQINEQIGN